MEKYEFRTKCTLMWPALALFVVAAMLYGFTMHQYVLIVTWGLYFIFLFITSIRTFIITPDSFTVKPKLLKAKTFLLKDIVEIERKFPKQGKTKSIIIRYTHHNMPHNFIELRKSEVDIDRILEAIIDYNPSVKVI